jgi:PemK-like, MazF-like toxin of type II toxin-antitoxin system
MTIPNPEVGLVISYAYLWHGEYRAGKEEGRKNRPSVIILATVRKADGATTVTVLPITLSASADERSAIEIPLSIKRHLRLDEARSWIVLFEGNEFLWPGYDLRKLPNTERYDLGFLPPRFFYQVLEAFGTYSRAGKRRIVSRE